MIEKSIKNSILFVFIIIICIQQYLNEFNFLSYKINNNNNNHLRRSLIENKHLNDYLIGSSNIVPNITVFGAMIMSQLGSEKYLEFSKTYLDNNNDTSMDIAAIRTKNAKELFKELPFPVAEWPGVFTKPCPQFMHKHKSERGVGLAHYQIWLDFLFFDNDVINALKRKEVKGIYSSTWYSSSSGTFSASENGTLYKHGIPYKEDDIIVIFEDDADNAIIDLNNTLIEELSSMTTDLLFLGWCIGRAAKPVPLCAHAYAMTRRGVRKAVEHYEPCGMAIDEQFVTMAKNKWITWRTAHNWSYKNRFNSNYPKSHDPFHGIFHQKRMGSFNGH